MRIPEDILKLNSKYGFLRSDLWNLRKLEWSYRTDYFGIHKYPYQAITASYFLGQDNTIHIPAENGPLIDPPKGTLEYLWRVPDTVQILTMYPIVTNSGVQYIAKEEQTESKSEAPTEA